VYVCVLKSSLDNGELLVSLCYKPHLERLTVGIFEGKDLKKLDAYASPGTPSSPCQSAKGVPGFFIWCQDRSAEGFLCGDGSSPPPHQLGGLGSAVSSPLGFGAESLDRPKVFHYFQHSGLASSDTIILLIVDYHATVGGQEPRAPHPHADTPATRMQLVDDAGLFRISMNFTFVENIFFLTGGLCYPASALTLLVG